MKHTISFVVEKPFGRLQPGQYIQVVTDTDGEHNGNQGTATFSVQVTANGNEMSMVRFFNWLDCWKDNEHITLLED